MHDVADEPTSRATVHWPLTARLSPPEVWAADSARVAYIVSRDKDLLALQRYGDTTIITPEAFMALARERRRATSTQ